MIVIKIGFNMEKILQQFEIKPAIKMVKFKDVQKERNL